MLYTPLGNGLDPSSPTQWRLEGTQPPLLECDSTKSLNHKVPNHWNQPNGDRRVHNSLDLSAKT